MSEEFDRLVAEFDRFEAKIRNVDERFARFEVLQERMVDLEASVTSPDRAVTVVAGPAGVIKDVRVSEDGVRLGGARLSATILATIQQAVAQAARAQAGVVQEVMGDDVDVVEQVLETQAVAFGTTVERMREQTADERPAPPRQDWAEEPIRHDDRPTRQEQPRRRDEDDFLRGLGHEED